MNIPTKESLQALRAKHLKTREAELQKIVETTFAAYDGKSQEIHILLECGYTLWELKTTLAEIRKAGYSYTCKNCTGGAFAYLSPEVIKPEHCGVVCGITVDVLR